MTGKHLSENVEAAISMEIGGFWSLEARAGIEPAHRGFADLDLTTWLPRRLSSRAQHSRGSPSRQVLFLGGAEADGAGREEAENAESG